jgi:DNA-binding MarR family transcriptional regulator
MSSEYPGGRGLEDRLMEAMRGLAVESAFFSQAVGDRLGMAGTDFSCLTVLFLEGAMTAGALAERAGLTTGAITGVLDRLERGRWARRVADPTDRRRVIVEARSERLGDIGRVLAPMLNAARTLHAGLDAEHLELIADYVDASRHMLAHQSRRLRQGAGDPSGDQAGCEPMRIRRAGADRGALRLVGGVGGVLIRGGEIGDSLCEIEMGAAPQVQARGGRITVRDGGRRLLDRHGRGRITLTPAVPWSIEVSHGASHLVAELAALDVVGVAVTGGASHIRIHLPAPRGWVPVTVAGGASRIDMLRPARVAVRLRVRGGWSNVTVDGRAPAPAGREAVLEAGGDGGGGYDLDITGGASRIEVAPL